MTELSIREDFLSKINTTNLYKSIISKNELDNLNKNDKTLILNSLIDTMKKKYKTLELPKINEKNITNVKKSFNDLCIKEQMTVIASIKKNNDTGNQIHDRKFDRDFNSFKKTVSISERPTSSIDDSAKQNMSISDRLKELEESRNSDVRKPNTAIPDFLKPVRVGKVDPAYNPSSIQSTDSKQPPKGLLGYSNDDESNFSSVSLSSNKFNDSMTVQERLSQLEKDRQMPPSAPTSNTSSFPPPQQTSVNLQNHSQNNPQNNMQPSFPPPQQTSVHTQNNQQNNMQPSFPPPQQTSVHTQNHAQNNMQPSFPPPQQTSVNSQNHAQNNMQNNISPQNTYSPPNYSPQQTQPNYPQQQPNYHQQPSTDSINMINSLSRTINEMKLELDSLKNTKKQFTKKSLQLEINKTDSLYKYSFSSVENVISLKLVSYDLPPPIYNINEDTYFNYMIDNNDTKINIKLGYYSIEKLIKVLNTNNDLIFSLDDRLKVQINTKDENKQFKIIPNIISYKLGFVSNKDNIPMILADRIYDLRLPTKLNFYIMNLQEAPIGILNFNGTSICDLNFSKPTVLNKLDIKFTTEDDSLYNFNNIPYNLSFIVDIIVS
jgi:hypothetical protein